MLAVPARRRCSMADRAAGTPRDVLRKRRRWIRARTPSVPIAVVLMLVTAVLLAAAVGLVLFAGYRAARLNTVELARQGSESLIRSVAERTRSYLDPVRAQLDFLAERIVRDSLDLNSPDRLGDLLFASLAAVPQESVVAFATPDLQVLRAFRNRPKTPLAVSDWREDPGFEEAMLRASRSNEAYWGELYVTQGREMPFINLFVPVRRDGTFIGALIAGVTTKDLSEFLATLGGSNLINPFILYGPDAVLAHPLLRNGWKELSAEHPLPSLRELGDPVLERIWAPDPEQRLQARGTFSNAAVSGRIVDVDGRPFIFLLQELPGYGARPWTVGTYMPLEEAVPQLDRLTHLLWIGGVVLVLGLALALLIGRSLSQPIQELAAEANRLRELNFDAPPPRLRGPFRELNEAARAFDAMVGGLRLFATYVPRSLVRRLMRHGSPKAISSQEREVTVMFTDIAGFTALSERLPAAEVADFLNGHFTLVGGCVEASDGTIDKYIGDAVMAFWGAPGEQPDHAKRACHTALEIARVLRADNEARAARAQPAVRMRIGIYSGRAVVGNIGAPSRVNYTVVGDVVNVAERLEELARTATAADEEVSILIGSSTAERLEPNEFWLCPLGAHAVRGRREPLEVFQLRLGPGDAAPPPA
jgi:adenylate cyclase